MAAESLKLGGASGLELNDLTTRVIERLTFTPAKKKPLWAENPDADGELLVEESHYTNSMLEIQLRIKPQASMDTALTALGTLITRLQDCEKTEGGIELLWQPGNATNVWKLFAISADVNGLPITATGDDAGWLIKSPLITFTITCRPFLYGTETSISASSGSDPIKTVDIANVAGDVPAEGRIVITDQATQNRRHFEWGLEQRHYNPASPSDLLLDSDELVTTGFAGTGTTRTGAYDPGAAGNSVIRATLTTTAVTVCGTDTADADSRSHVGSFRVKARVFASGTGPYYVRLAWRSGDAPLVRNAYIQPLDDQWSEVDLGEIHIEEIIGTQSWEGRIEARSDTPGDTLDVDYLIIEPIGAGYGKAQAPLRIETPGTFSARDEFDQTSGNLTGKTLPVGGTWSGAGDADDFTVNTTDRTARRTATLDVDSSTGRYVVISSAGFALQAVTVDIKLNGMENVTGLFPGVLARYADTSNWLRATLFGGTLAGRSVVVWKRVAGTVTALAESGKGITLPTATTAMRMTLLVDAAGRWSVWYGLASAPSAAPLLFGKDSDLATGGALASGKPGIYDAHTAGGTPTRDYDNFAAWVPSLDAVCFSGRKLEINSTDTIRENAAGTRWGDVPHYRGARFYLPPAGPDSRTSRLLTKLRRNDLDELPDDNIADQHQVQVFWTPRYLTPR